MKFRLRFFGDPRNDDQKKRYETLEQKRADVWLTMALARTQRARLYGLLPNLARRQAE